MNSKLKGRVIAISLSSLMIFGAFVGCSKVDIGSKKDDKEIVVNDELRGILEVAIQYDYKGAKKDDLIEKVNEIIEDEDIMKENKALVVKFYDLKEELYFDDIIPYAYGYWGPEEGVEDSFDLISSRNNKTYVLFSTPMDVGLTADDEALLPKLFEDLKPTEGLSGLKTEMIDKYLNEEFEFSMDKDKAASLVEKIGERYKDDAYQNIKFGIFE